MAFEADEDLGLLVSHILFGLERENLIGVQFSFGEAEHIRKAIYPGAPGAGLVFGPSPLGVELFLWAHGLGQAHPLTFFSTDFGPMPMAEVATPTGGVAVHPREAP
jgi:hypothetical protein